MVENFITSKMLLRIYNEHLTFVSLILSLIFQKKVRTICLKLLLRRLQSEINIQNLEAKKSAKMVTIEIFFSSHLKP